MADPPGLGSNSLPEYKHWETSRQKKQRKLFFNFFNNKVETKKLEYLSIAWLMWKDWGCVYPFPLQNYIEELNQEIYHLMIEQEMKLTHARPKLTNITRKKTNLNVVSMENTTCNREEEIELSVSKEFPSLKLYYKEGIRIEEQNVISILHESTQKCRCSLDFIDAGLVDSIVKTKSQTVNQFKCIVNIDGKYVAEGSSGAKKDAKRITAINAIYRLINLNVPVIYDTNHDKLTVIETDLLRKDDGKTNKLGADNIGNKLMMKMGWSGSGGIGKTGREGRAEPVTLNDYGNHRRGLGSYDEISIDRRSVSAVLDDFMRNTHQKDVKFSSDLSKDDRVIVHRLCERYNLKHRSHGKADDRYIVVSKKI